MIFVTGGTGLVGSHLLFELARKEESVRALYRTEQRREHVREIFALFSRSADELFNRIDWIQGDLHDFGVLEDALAGVELVFHCAALVSFNPRDRRRLFHINEQGTANIVNLSLVSGVRKLAYVSSVAALGRADGSAEIDEQTVWKPDPGNSSYGISKYNAEQQVWRGIEEGLPAVIVNPGIILGPGFWEEGSSRIFSNIAGGFSFYSEGVNGYVDVRDVVAALIELAGSDIENERFVLCADNTSYREVFTQMALALGVKPPYRNTPAWLGSMVWRVEALRAWLMGAQPLVTRETARAAQQKVRCSSSKIQKRLGFRFRQLKQTIEETAAHFPKG